MSSHAASVSTHDSLVSFTGATMMHPHLSQCAPSLWSPQTVSVLPLTISLSPRLPHCYSHCFMPHNCLVFHLADFRSSPAASMSSLCHSFPQETASVFPYHPCLMSPQLSGSRLSWCPSGLSQCAQGCLTVCLPVESTSH